MPGGPSPENRWRKEGKGHLVHQRTEKEDKYLFAEVELLPQT